MAEREIPSAPDGIRRGYRCSWRVGRWEGGVEVSGRVGER